MNALKPHDFEKYVSDLLKATGYTTTPQVELGTYRADIIAERIDSFMAQERILIECKTGRQSISSAHYEKLLAVFTQYRELHGLTRSLLIHDCTVTTAVSRAISQNSAGPQVVHISTLESNALGLPKERLIHNLALNLPDVPAFVDPGVQLRQPNEREAAVPYLRNFLSSHHQFLFLSGRIGSGKTTILHQFLSTLVRSPEIQNSAHAIPLLIPLKYYDHSSRDASLLDYIALRLRYSGLLPTIDPTKLASFLHDHRLFLILDGIDEIKLSGGDDEISSLVSDWLNELSLFLPTIFSCRTSFFSMFLSQFIDAWNMENSEKAVVAQVNDFGIEQVIEYAKRSANPILLARLRGKEISSLMTRPIFLRTASRFPALNAYLSANISATEFIEHALRLMLQHSSSSRSAFLSYSQWDNLFVEIAERMVTSGIVYFDRDFLRTILSHSSVALRISDVDDIANDAAFRTIFELSDGNFSFAHFLFFIYYSMRSLVGKIGSEQSLSRRTFRISSNDEFLLTTYDHFLRDRIKNLRAPRPLRRHKINWWRIPRGAVLVRAASSRRGVTRALDVIEKSFFLSETCIAPGHLLPYVDRLDDKDLIEKVFACRTSPRNTWIPLTGITHRQAMRIASALGGRLPTEFEWQWAAMPLQASNQYQAAGERTDIPHPSNLERNLWGVKGCLRNVWQWTSTLDIESNTYVCCGGWWGDRSTEDENWRLLPTELSHRRTDMRVVLQDHE